MTEFFKPSFLSRLPGIFTVKRDIADFVKKEWVLQGGHEIDDVVSLSHSSVSTTTRLTWFCVKIANIWAWVPLGCWKKKSQHIHYDLQSVCVYFSRQLILKRCFLVTLWMMSDQTVYCKMQLVDDNDAFCRCLYFNGNVLCTVTACLNFCKCCVSIWFLLLLSYFWVEILYCIVICLKHGNTER